MKNHASLFRSGSVTVRLRWHLSVPFVRRAQCEPGPYLGCVLGACELFGRRTPEIGGNR